MDRIITSAENRVFKALVKLLEPRGMKKQERGLVAGAKLVRELAAARPEDCRTLIVSERMQHGGLEEVVRRFEDAGRLVVLRQGLFRQLDMFATGGPLLEMRLPDVPDWSGRLSADGCTLALPLQDPANLGAAARSAAAFGVTDVVLLQEAAHPYQPKSIRASAGAVFKLNFFRGPALAQLGRVFSARDIVALDMQGEPVGGFAFPERFLLLAGMEGQGLPAELRTRAVSIPMAGAVESLNAAAALSIALFCWSSRNALQSRTA